MQAQPPYPYQQPYAQPQQPAPPYSYRQGSYQQQQPEYPQPHPDPMAVLAAIPAGSLIEIELEGNLTITGELRQVRITPPGTAG